MQRDAPPPANEPAASEIAQPPSANPFATRHVRPGAIPYLFSDETTLESLVARLAGNEWRGEIIGPHGTGKSTLVAALLPYIERTGRKVVLYRLREGGRRLPAMPRDIRSLAAGDVLVVDGYEQLPRWRQWLLCRQCRRRGIGILATAHAATGLPQLWQTPADLATLERVVDRLLATQPETRRAITPDDIAAALAAHPSNVREALFTLYDLVEVRRRASSAQRP